LTFEAPPLLASGRWVRGNWVATNDVRRASADAELESSPRGFLIPFRWEVAAYITLVVVALLLRTWGLGDRAVHHDESLHGFFAWDLYQGNPYLHNPLTHGMFLFHSIAASFFLFGDSDFTLRLPMALFGAGLVAAPLLLRNRMGQFAALTAAVMITFSPTLLYFSRFARNDIFVAVFTLMLIGAMFRYIDEKRDRWLYVGAAAIALGFTAKENMYIVVAIVGAYLLWRAAPEVWDWLMGRISMREFSPTAGFLVLVAGLSLPLFAAAVSPLDSAFNLNMSATNGTPGLATGEPAAGWSFGIAVTVVVLLIGAGWAIGLLWKPKVWMISWAIFALIFSLMFTNFFTHPGGIGSGVWQSLGYWLEQQDVHRGDQPWYYYFMITSAYEFLPFTLTIGTAAFIAYRTGFWAAISLLTAAAFLSVALYFSVTEGLANDDKTVRILTVFGVFMLAIFAMYAKTTSFKRFVLFWSILSFVAYTLAGEKMPWLLTHITLPFIIVAATVIGDIVMHVNWNKALHNGNWMLLIGVPVFLLLLWRLIFIDIEGSVGGFVSLFLLLTVLGLMLVAQQWLGSRIGHSAAWGSAALVMVLVMFAFTFRAGWIASFVNKDVPHEMLIYTQTSQDIRQVVNEIQTAGTLTGDGKDILLSIDTADSFSWPWHWYLRGYTSVRFNDLSLEDAEAEKGVKIAVINTRNNDKVLAEYVEGYTQPRRIQHRAWFPEDYKNIMTPKVFWDTIWARERWRRSVDFFIYREISGEIGSVDSYVYFNETLPLSPLD
jgi:uncharacterized protein (TIGR03663 family)